MQDVITALEAPRPLQGQDIQGFFDNANRLLIAPRVSANFTDFLSGEGNIVTNVAEAGRGLKSFEGFGQVF